MPDRIEFTLTSDRHEIAVGRTRQHHRRRPLPLRRAGRWPGARRRGNHRNTREWEDFPNFQFGLADEQEGEATRIPLADLPVVGDDGKATFPVQIDALPSTTRLLTADVTVRMRESGGRAVEESSTSASRPQGDMIGIRPDFAGGEVPQGATREIHRHRRRSGRQAQGVCPARSGRWSGSSATTSGTAAATPGTTSRSSHQGRSNGTLDIAADGTASSLDAGRLGPLPPRNRNLRPRGPGHKRRIRCPAGMWRRPRPTRRTG